MTDSSVVYVVDDDPSVRKSTGRLIRSAGYKVETFKSADEFLDRRPSDGPSCLILDMRMPGLNGLDLQERLAEAGAAMPIIFVTGHASVSSTVRAMKAGAVELLEKPFKGADLIEAIGMSLRRAEVDAGKRERLEKLREREKRLTPREHAVFELVVSGLLNKQIARDLSISEKTVKVHRARVMEKMEVRMLANLVLSAGKLGFPREPQAVLSD